jgi:hypothetical protein
LGKVIFSKENVSSFISRKSSVERALECGQCQARNTPHICMRTKDASCVYDSSLQRREFLVPHILMDKGEKKTGFELMQKARPWVSTGMRRQRINRRQRLN